MPVNTNTTKRRRFIRYAIELEAALIVGKSAPIHCYIQDFCSGGLFLGFKQPISEELLPEQKGIKLQFSVSPELGWDTFQLDAAIRHVRPNGIGVAVENMPVAAFSALKKVANKGAKAVVSDRRNSSEDKLSQDSCKNAITELLVEALPQLLGRFFERLNEDFKSASEQEANFTDRSALEDLVTTLKFSRDSIISEFCSSVLAEVDYIADPNHKFEAENAAEGTTLALIEKDDFEDWLNLSAAIRRLTIHYKSSISQIEGKLSHVFGVPSHTINNPVSPGVLCESFRSIIQEFIVNNRIKLTIYTIFEKLLTNSLSHLYDQIDAILVDYGAPKNIALQVVKQPVTIKPAVAAVETRPSEHHEQDIEQRDRSGWPPVLISNDKVLDLLALAEQKNRQPVVQVASKLLNILKEAEFAPAGEAQQNSSGVKTILAGQSQPFYSADEITAALAKVQKSAGDHKNLHQNSNTLQKYLRDALQSSGAGDKTLAVADISQLEIHGRLFETLLNDLMVSSDIKSYIESIHLPLLSLTLQGNDFLESDAHPARKLLNQLATLESAVKGNRTIKKTNIKNILDKVISRISQEAGSNPEVFAEAERELSTVTDQVAKTVDLNIRRIVEAYEGQQKLETARRFVQSEIDKLIAGKPIPSIIHLLLTSGWQHLLVIIELNQEKTQTEKLLYYQILNDLIYWLGIPGTIPDAQTAVIIKAITFIEDQLSMVCTNAFLRDRIIDELHACLLGVKSDRRKSVEMVTIEPQLPIEGESMAVIDDHWLLQVEQLQVGEWLTIIHNDQGFEPMKLVWIGDSPKIFVFVNNDGLNKLEFSKAELAELMRNGAANRIENLDVPLMDRATNMMLQNMHEKLIYNATHDSVTNLYNKEEFIKQLKHEMAKLGHSRHILCHIEVQDFRMISNICGVVGGNQLLKKITQLMTDQLRDEELFARLGDKTFGILFKNCSSDEGYEIAKKLINVIGTSHFEWQNKSYSISVSIGLAPFIGNDYDVHQLLQQADSASLSAERSGHNRIQMFKEDDETLKHQIKLHEWAGQIDKILTEDRLFLRCQKIASADTGKNSHSHYEILLGLWDHAGNVVPPDNFIPAAERCKRMPEIDQWIIRRVFAWIEEHRDYFDQTSGFSINLSGQSINTEEFLDFLKELLASSTVQPEKITFEITETVAVDSLLYVKKFIKQIKQFGCKFSLDDFGSGYSSYSYLKSLNVDYLKIDGAFVKDIASNSADVAIVKSMNEIAHSLGMETIAEYVENEEILAILRDIGVDYVQGYGIQKPILLTELIEVSGAATDTGDDYWDL